MFKRESNSNSTVLLVLMAVMVAMEIILERFISIPVGNISRFSIGKTVVVLSGLWFGPISGALVGAVSDILGGLLQGYGLSINPFITLSSMMWGVIPALVMRNTKWAGTTKNTKRIVILCVSIFVNSIISTLGLTTLGLVIVYGYNFFALLPTRLVQFAALVPVYCIVTCLLYFSPLTGMVRSMLYKKESYAR